MELNVSPRVAWLLIILGGVFQVGWSIGLDYTEGMTNILWDIIVLVSLLLSMLCLSIPMKSGISISTAYAVWVGLGVVLTIIVSAMPTVTARNCSTTSGASSRARSRRVNRTRVLRAVSSKKNTPSHPVFHRILCGSIQF